MASSPRITELAAIISSNTAKIVEYLRSQNLPQPSFDLNAPIQPIPDAPPEIEEAQTLAVEASLELQQLLQGGDSLILPEVRP